MSARGVPVALGVPVWGLLVASALFAACGPAAPATRVPEAPMTLDAVLLSSGTRLDPEALSAYLAEASVVYVGERHDVAVDHRVEAAIIELTRPDLVGMEMFQRPFHGPLDAYGRGELDEPGMLLATEWAERWGMPFDVYREVVETSRRVSARIIALNAPREWTRAISRGGLESLTPEMRADLPELDTENAEHRAMVMEALSGHAGHGGGAMSPQMLEGFYLAQLTWDETMGDSVARALAEAGPDAHAVVLAGRMHVQRGLGIPRCAARRGVSSHRIVLPLTDAEIAAEQSAPTGLADVAIRVPE